MNTLKKELVSVRIPEPLNRKLAEHVAPLGMSKNAFILSLINKELSQNKTTDYHSKKDIGTAQAAE